MKYSVCSVCLPEYSIEDTVKLLRDTGYEGVEWRVAQLPPAVKPANMDYSRRYWHYNRSTVDENALQSEAVRVRKLCDEAGIETVLLSSYRGVWETETAVQLMQAAPVFGCRNLRIKVPDYDGKEHYRELFDRTLDQVREIEQLARQYDVRVNFEIHMGTIIPSASAAYRLVSHFDPDYVGVIYDPGNFIYEGYENYQMGVELLSEYIAHVHVKNAIWKINDSAGTGADKWEAQFAPLHRGYANYTRIFEVLKAAKYNGWLSVEDFSNEADTRTKLHENRSFLQEMIKTVGGEAAM